MSPSALINAAVLFITIIMLVGAGLAGYGIRSTQCGEQLAKIEASISEREKATATRAIAQANEQAEIDKEILNQAAIKLSQLNTKTVYLTTTVVKHVASEPVYRDCVVPPVGMCFIRAAARGESGESCTRRADDSMPTSTRAGE